VIVLRRRQAMRRPSVTNSEVHRYRSGGGRGTLYRDALGTRERRTTHIARRGEERVKEALIPRRTRRAHDRFVVLSAGAVLLASLLTGPDAPGGPGLATAGAGTGLHSYVAVGDSITAGMVPDADTVATPGATSWLNGETEAHLQRVGGWAYPGALTADMRAGFTPVRADVLVLLGGTNDLARGIPWGETRANLRAIAASAGTGAVLLVAIPPNDQSPKARSAYNARLDDLAAREQWRFVDPWTDVDAGGAWATGTTVDGIHATPQVAAAAGTSISDAVWRAAMEETAG
jgi:lysophospholipase L1-like esterase